MTHPDCSIYNLTLSCDPRPSPYASEHCLQLYDKGGHIAVGDGETALDYHVAELWSRIVQRFGTNFTPRSIARHKLIAKLDGCNDGYLKHRAAIEVALAAAKAKGLVTTRTLLNGRAGKYLRLYHDAEEAAPNDPWRTIYQLCVQLGLQECSFSREVLSLAGAGEQARPQAMDYDTFMGSPLDGLIARLKDAGAIIDERELREALGEMHRGDEVEVVPPRLTAGLELCAQPTFFSTLTALRAYTAREIESSAYTTLLCVAETGKWLVSAAAAIPQDRHVGLIVADVSQMRRIGEAYHGRLCKPEKPLPWWLHNQHTTIFVQDRVARKAIHFERRLRSPRIAPVVVEGMDAEYLMDYFFAYWVKAESAAGGHITRDAINAAKEKFFRDV